MSAGAGEGPFEDGIKLTSHLRSVKEIYAVEFSRMRASAAPGKPICELGAEPGEELLKRSRRQLREEMTP